MLRIDRGTYSLDPYEGTANLTRSRSLTLTPGADPIPRPIGLTVAILNLDRPDLIGPALDAMAQLAPALSARGWGFEVVVGDTGSSDPAVREHYAAAPSWLTVIDAQPYQFSRSNNQAVAAAPVSYDTVLLLNNDVLLPSATPILAMCDALATDPRVAVVGLCLQFPDGTVQHAGVDIVGDGFRRGLPWHPLAGSAYTPAPSPYPSVAVTGACLMIRRSVWDAVAGLDEAYESECQDVDLCLAVRRLGHEVVVVDAGPVVHLENATRGTDDGSLPDRRRFIRRWSSYVQVLSP